MDDPKNANLEVRCRIATQFETHRIEWPQLMVAARPIRRAHRFAGLERRDRIAGNRDKTNIAMARGLERKPQPYFLPGKPGSLTELPFRPSPLMISR